MSMKHRIVEVRRQRGLTQKQLADGIGATQSMVGKLERGEREMTFSWLSRIAHVLEVPTGELLDATDEPVLVGHANADGTVVVEDTPQLWDAPDGSPSGAMEITRVNKEKVGVELMDDATIRIPANSLLVYEGPQRRPTREMAGRLVLAMVTEQPLSETQEYKPRLGILMPGSDSRRYHVIPFSGPPLTDVLVHWVFEITEIRM